MAYLGNTPTTQSFISGTDYFNGDGSTTAFTLSRTVNSVNDVEVVINNVEQQPNTAYNISGTTITFTSAPSAGTGNIYVRYLSTTTQSITPSQNTVSWNTLNTNTQGALGISFKNRIINGAMVIDQRNAGASVTIGAGTSTYVVDRWLGYASFASKFSLQQNAGGVTAPAGFVNYLGATSLAATTVGSGDIYCIQQNIEGYNIADLNWGTNNAKTVTLSFWVYSSITGTFGGAIRNGTGARSYPFSYSIGAANTWTQISITVAGDTTGTYATTNSSGLLISFGLGVGSTYSGTAGTWASANYASATGAAQTVATNGATFYITGVQLEVGTQATTFDYRDYGREFIMCQRYYQVLGTGSIGRWFSTTGSQIEMQFPVSFRSSPSVSAYSQTVGYVVMGTAAGTTSSFSPAIANGASTTGADLYVTTNAVGVNGSFATFTTNGMAFSAEL